MSDGFSLRRLRALLAKELIQMRRDRITFAMMLGVPLMQLMLFGFAINNDPKGLPAALVAPAPETVDPPARPSRFEKTAVVADASLLLTTMDRVGALHATSADGLDRHPGSGCELAIQDGPTNDL